MEALKILAFLAFVILLTGFLLTGCTQKERFNYATLDYFDTLTSIMGYAESRGEFDYFVEIMIVELGRLHQLFNQFETFDGLNNIKTINDYAGIRPVEVESEIIEMLNAGILAEQRTNGIVNIALGAVTNIWREYIDANADILPCMDRLITAGEFTNIADIVIDGNTVFLREPNMYLDVGSIAKGFAIERVTQTALEAGFESFTLTVGGDVRLTGSPLNRDAWGVGILDPNNPGEIIDSVFVKNTAVFTSGDYLRYYIVGGEAYHHIIDPRTLMPAVQARSVTVIYPCGIVAEYLSLAAFILGEDEASQLLSHYNEAVWIRK
ncbi:MAG: FAD:protein FMN transferase [Defluviitaleaceae bacterium]|nr:FAD:protein FMN transferase [Defluviitaleaceae bacterium]